MPFLFRVWQVDCAYSGIDRGRTRMLPLLSILGGCPYEGVLEKVLCRCCMAHRPLEPSTPPSDGLALAGHREVRAALLRKHKS